VAIPRTGGRRTGRRSPFLRIKKTGPLLFKGKGAVDPRRGGGEGTLGDPFHHVIKKQTKDMVSRGTAWSTIL